MTRHEKDNARGQGSAYRSKLDLTGEISQLVVAAGGLDSMNSRIETGNATSLAHGIGEVRHIHERQLDENGYDTHQENIELVDNPSFDDTTMYDDESRPHSHEFAKTYDEAPVIVGSQLEVTTNEVATRTDLRAAEDAHRNTEPHAYTSSIIFSPGVQLYCLAMLCGSLMKACSKILVGDLDIFVVLLCRMFLTTVLSMAVMWKMGVEHYFWGHREIRVLLFVRGALGFFNIACTYFALQYLSLPDQAVISFLTPMTTSMGARLFLKEDYNWQQALASLVSLCGVVIIARPPFLFGHFTEPMRSEPDPTESPSASKIARLRTLAVVSSMCVVLSASAVMIILRKIKERAHALTSVANYAVITVVCSSIILVLRPSQSWAFPATQKSWLLVILMGTFGFLLQYLSSKAIQMEEATTLSNFKYTQLLYATTLEFIFWHDVPDRISVLGMLFILAGVLCAAHFKARRNSNKTQ